MAKKSIANQSISFDGASFDKAFIASHKTEADFLEAMSDKTHAHLFEGENREAKLKELYAKVVPQSEVVGTEETIVGEPGEGEQIITSGDGVQPPKKKK